MPNLPTRSAAKATGVTRYLGKPCPAGHRGERYTLGAGCVECAAARKRWETKRPVTSEARPALPEPKPLGLTLRQARLAAEAAAGLRRAI